MGRLLEETGILPERSYGPVLRARVASSAEMMLTGGLPAEGGDAGAALVHRFRRIGEGEELFGFLCVSSRRGEPEPAAVLSETLDLRNSLQVISNQSELLLSEMPSGPAAPRLREILRAVQRLLARTAAPEKAQTEGAKGSPVDAERA